MRDRGKFLSMSHLAQWWMAMNYAELTERTPPFVETPYYTRA